MTTLFRVKKTAPSPMFLALSWRPSRQMKRSSRSSVSALNFSSQFARLTWAERIRWRNEAQLAELPPSKHLFQFSTLSPDGIVLEAQKKAFTRVEK